MHELGIGGHVDLEALEADVARTGAQWLAAVHHETTTGLLNPIADIADMAERHDARLFLDANSNKCLESLPGIAGVFWRAGLTSHATVPVLDETAYAAGIPSTPHVLAFIALDVALDLLTQEGRPARYARLARSVWEAADGRFAPLLDERDRSNVLTFRIGCSSGRRHPATSSTRTRRTCVGRSSP